MRSADETLAELLATYGSLVEPADVVGLAHGRRYR